MNMMKLLSRGRIFLILLSVAVIFTIVLSSSCSAPVPTSPTTPSTPDLPAAQATPDTAPTWQPPEDGFKLTSPPSSAESAKGFGQAWPPNLPRYESNSDTIGLAAGGAKDVNNFRENIENGYLPLPTDITYEGLFYDYSFDTGQTEPCDALFCPSYSTAVSRDPFSGEKEYYLSVGLNSGLKQSDFERKKLNLVIVLDISGSMSSPFDEYYYDRGGSRINLDYRERNIPKIEVAKDAIQAILYQLNDDDSLSIVLFNNRAHLLQRFKSVDGLDMEDVEDNIYEISPGGGTDLSSGMRLATDILNEMEDMNPYVYENRIIFLTDAMPNLGELGKYSLLNMFKDNARDNIYTTFIGIGVDFNSELVEYIAGIRGANYYSAHSPGEFMSRVEDEFDYMVTPLVFDLRLKLQSSGWDIEQVYGSPQADRSTGELMKIDTLFPSERKDGETRGGLVLLKLKKKWKNPDSIDLIVTCEDRGGEENKSKATVSFDDDYGEYFDNSGIHKGVVLSRYANLIQDWIIDERRHLDHDDSWDPCVNYDDGIILPDWHFSDWERQSLSLRVSYHYRSIFQDFTDYFSDEIEYIGDDTMEQELYVMDTLTRFHY
jgi:Ca-activated chloride channel family protein